MRRTILLGVTLVLTALGAVRSLPAASISTEAFDNATVQPGGPRAPTSGKNFFNVEGSANGNFASYGVADFDFGVLPTVLGINSATLELAQSNAGFTTDGSVIVSLDTSATLADIQSGGSSPLAFDGNDPGTDTDVSDGDLTLAGLGTFNFVEIANGNVDSYSLTLTPAIETELISRLNAGGVIRLVIGTGADTVAATWAGFGNSTYEGPTLIIDAEVVPEPGTALFVIAGAMTLIARRRPT